MAEEVVELDPGLNRELDHLVDDRLFAEAEKTDVADQLPVAHFEALATLGLYGMTVPESAGGLGLSGPQIRGVLRRLGSGCGATAFAFAQHHGTTATVAGTANQELRQAWLPRLVDDTLAGIAYAHVRRPGNPVLAARPAAPGDPSSTAWILDGQAPWVTSWGLAEVLGVAARTEDGRLVWALVPAREGDGLRVAKRFDLAVLGASMTVALDFEGYRVEPDHLIDVVDFPTWAAHDRHLAARPNPLCLGIGDRALRLLGEVQPERADQLLPSWEALTRRAEAQSQAVDRREADLATVAAARAEAVLATQQLTTALLAGVGGRGMEVGHPAQRLHREAGFYVVQALNDVGRDALLDRVGLDRVGLG